MKKPKGYIHGQTFYPLGNHYPGACFSPSISIGNNIIGTRIMAQWSGEYREPKKGEWYLSGSPGTAYKALNDLSTKYFIAKIVKVTPITTFKVTEL